MRVTQQDLEDINRDIAALGWDPPLKTLHLRLVEPPEDPADRAMYAVFAAEREFREELHKTTDPARRAQLRERLTAMATVLLKLESEAGEQ